MRRPSRPAWVMSASPEPAADLAIPVWLVTGYLGSGKTTLLSRWLLHADLHNAAVIINEIGETGFDDQVLARSLGSASSLLAGRCVCCSGLEDLQQTLASLWWARLWRERPWFDCVVIETTGLADPRPLLQAFAEHELLRRRYRLQAVITTISSQHDLQDLIAHESARQQLAWADAVVVTKVDEQPVDSACMAQLQDCNPHAVRLSSAMGSLTWPQLRAALSEPSRSPGLASALPSAVLGQGTEARGVKTQGTHLAAVQHFFAALPEAVLLEQWPDWLGQHLVPGVQRVKGYVRALDGPHVSVQWCYGNTSPRFEAVLWEPGMPLGLTVIADPVQPLVGLPS